MSDQQPSDATLGTAGSGDGAPRPVKPLPARPDDKGDKPPAGNSVVQDRPNSDPKNPGDFGHH